MEKDYSSWHKYSVEFVKNYIIPNEKGITESIAKTKAIEMLSYMIQEIEKEAEKRRKEEDESEIMKLLMSLEPQKEGKKLTIKDQVSLFDVQVEKSPNSQDYIAMFQYKFEILMMKTFSADIVKAIAQKESLSKFSINVQDALGMKVKRIYE